MGTAPNFLRSHSVDYMSGMNGTWNDLRLEADRLFLSFVASETDKSAQTGFDAETIDNVRDFIDYAQANYPLADEIMHGYWPTICLYWSKAEPHPVEIEIFDDHFEFQRFIDRVVDISHFDHCPGDPFPPDLAAILRTELR